MKVFQTFVKPPNYCTLQHISCQLMLIVCYIHNMSYSTRLYGPGPRREILYSVEKTVSCHVAWASHGSIEAAWDSAVGQIGGPWVA